MLTNLEHKVTYDSTGRLISKEVLDLSATSDRWLRSLEYNYDLNNNTTHIAYADKDGSNITNETYEERNKYGSIMIFDLGAYLIGGGVLSAGFDIDYIIEKWNEIW